MLELSRQTRLDLLTTALEGGSNYWYYIDDVSEIDSSCEECSFVDALFDFLEKGGELVISDVEYPDEELGVLSMEAMKTGEALIYEEDSDFFNLLDEGDWDADDADKWFQCVVIGKIMFA